MFYKGIARIESMLSMTYEFNQERVVENLYQFMGRKGYLLHAVTVNEYLDKYSKGSDVCQEENENFIHKKVSRL